MPTATETKVLKLDALNARKSGRWRCATGLPTIPTQSRTGKDGWRYKAPLQSARQGRPGKFFNEKARRNAGPLLTSVGIVDQLIT